MHRSTSSTKRLEHAHLYRQGTPIPWVGVHIHCCTGNNIFDGIRPHIESALKSELKAFRLVITSNRVCFSNYFWLNIEVRGQLAAHGSYWKKPVFWHDHLLLFFFLFCCCCCFLNIQTIFLLIHSPNLSFSSVVMEWPDRKYILLLGLHPGVSTDSALVEIKSILEFVYQSWASFSIVCYEHKIQFYMLYHDLK